VRSMTGFGAGASAPTKSRVVCEARSVNSRSLDVRLRAPAELGDASLWAEQLTKKRLRRGRVELTFRVELESAPKAGFQRERAAAALSAFADLGRELGYPDRPPLTVLATVPGLFDERPVDDALLRSEAEQALGRALDELDKDRAREGGLLAEELQARANTVAATLARVAARAETLPDQFRARLKARVARLGTDLDPIRVEQEVALLADRCDVAEEVSRLGSHTAHFLELLSSLGDADGRRLDFLLQEMMREATTLAAKAQDAEVSREIVNIKVELDRMREQVQNVE